MILLARAIWSCKGSVVIDGALRICDDAVVAVGSKNEINPLRGEPVVDLGDSIILPAFVNAHCHLDYTGLAGRLNPGLSFTDWVDQIIEVKRSMTMDEQESSWLLGAQMLMESGCGMVFNIESVPGLFSRMVKQTPLQVCPFTELIGFDDGDDERLVHLAKRELSENAQLSMVAGLAPHSPYTTTAKVLNTLAGYADQEGIPITVHVSESEDEWEMFTAGSGALFDKMKGLGRIMGDCCFESPVQYFNHSGGAALRTLVVHANYLINEDFDFLAKPGLSVVHCPQSHSWFGYPEFEYKRLAKKGVNVCLGTDSLASSGRAESAFEELNMFDEMRKFKSRNPGIDIDDILDMATYNGAKAMGLERQLGQLREGMLANFSIIPFPKHLSDLKEAIISHEGCVSGLFIAGKHVFAGKQSIAD
jgi:cytosine/adenosine deaminase-related metal-dependent hydrolase